MDHELLVARDDHVGTPHLATQSETIEDEPDHPQVLGHRVLHHELSTGHARQRHERPDLDVIGRDRVRASAKAGGPVNRHHVRANPVDRGAHRHEHPRQVLHVRLRRSVADHRRTAGQRGRHQRVLGRHHGGLVHQEVARPESERGLELDVVVTVSDRGAERPERVEVGVQSAAADDVTARRRHVRAAEARQQRTRK